MEELTFAYIPPKDKNASHVWTAKGPLGAVHIHACRMPETDLWPEKWSGGCEVHSPKPMYGDCPPHHDHCWLLEGPCWHDGSSLYFSENIAWWLDDCGPPFGEVAMTRMKPALRLFYRNLEREEA